MKEVIAQFNLLIAQISRVISWNPHSETWRIEHWIYDRDDERNSIEEIEVYIDLDEIDGRWRVDFDGLKDQTVNNFQQAVELAIEWMGTIAFQEWRDMVEEREADCVSYEEMMIAYANVQDEARRWLW